MCGGRCGGGCRDIDSDDNDNDDDDDNDSIRDRAGPDLMKMMKTTTIPMMSIARVISATGYLSGGLDGTSGCAG